jgi:serine/threonine protein kinase
MPSVDSKQPPKHEFWIPGLTHISPVAEGGQAQVFRALDEENRWVAVKVLRKRARHDRAMHRRLRKEAGLMRGFDHPCILPLYREGVLQDGRPYLISPWIEGTSLRDAPPLLSPGQVASFFVDVLDAVGHAHQSGVLHRDLHPRNLFMTQRYRACVLDFGVAKIGGRNAAESETRDGQLLGVERYSAPEVLRFGSKHATAAGDVYSLGLILREFAARFESLGLPGELGRLLRFCCAESRGGRYRDAAELAAAFRMWRNGMPVPRPNKRGLSRRSLIAATPLLLASMVFFLNPAAPSRLPSSALLTRSSSLVDHVLPVRTEDDSSKFEQRHALLELCASVDALSAPYEAGAVLEPSGVRRLACDRVAGQLARLAGLPNTVQVLLDLLGFRIGMARLDSVLEMTRVEGDLDRFRLGPISSQELDVLRGQRDQSLANLLAENRGTRMAEEAEFRSLLQEARLPQSRRVDHSVDPLIGWTRAEASRFSVLLDQMKTNEAPSEWIALGSARRSLSRLKGAMGGRQASFRDSVQIPAKQIEAWLLEYPNQQALEVRHMRAELADLMGD